MVELSHWRDIVVSARHDTGCIPTGYEWIIRYLSIEGVELTTFQEDFDFDREHTGSSRNSFESIGNAIMSRYPQINIRYPSFPKGHEKIERIRRLLEDDIPCLISLSLVGPVPSGDNESALMIVGAWHIMPVVEIDERNIKTIWNADVTCRLPIQNAILIHDSLPGGKDISWIEVSSNDS